MIGRQCCGAENRFYLLNDRFLHHQRILVQKIKIVVNSYRWSFTCLHSEFRALLVVSHILHTHLTGGDLT